MNDTIDTITLGVANLSTARRFFEEGFGSRCHSDGETVTFELAADDSVVPFTLVPWDVLASSAEAAPESSGFRGYALSYIVESAAQVDAVIERLKLAGGVISRAPRGVVWGIAPTSQTQAAAFGRSLRPRPRHFYPGRGLHHQRCTPTS